MSRPPHLQIEDIDSDHLHHKKQYRFQGWYNLKKVSYIRIHLRNTRMELLCIVSYIIYLKYLVDEHRS